MNFDRRKLLLASAAVLPLLVKELKTTKETAAMDLIRSCDPVVHWDGSAAPLLLERFRRAVNKEFQAELAAILGVICRRDASQVPAILQLLEDEKLRPLAVRVLGGAGPSARAAAPDLRRLARSGDPQLQVEAARALEAVERVEEPSPIKKMSQ